MSDQIAIELLRLVPTLIWAGMLVLALFMFREPIRIHVLPRVTHFKVLGLEIEASVKENLDRVAASTPQAVGGNEQRTQVARRASRLSVILREARILLVNDIPAEMSYVIKIFGGLGMSVEVATSTEQALDALMKRNFDVIISDMRRGENATAGLELLRGMRVAGYRQPVIFTVGEYKPEKGVPPFSFGITNRVDELLNLVFDALERVRA